MKRSPVLLSASLLLGLACQEPTNTSPAEQAVEVTSSAAVLQHADELARIDAELAAVLARAAAQPRGWLALERAAELHLTRARLSGSYDDYARADELITRAFTVAGDGVGPFLTRARLNFTLHRLDRVAADLERIAGFAIPRAEDREALVVLHADLAFQQGRYEEALQGFERALATREDITNLARLALYRWKTGEFLPAEDLYHRALAKLPPRSGETAAWLHLQLGLMDLGRGRHDEALAHYQDGAHELGGYWLIDEHIAEIWTLQGKTDAALRAYEDIVERTDSPEFMDAIAGIHLAAGRAELARPWIARARQRYEAQLARFPEAAHGHALGHFLEFGADPARAVSLAEANHRTRPNAEAKISLARAYLEAGRGADARTIIAEALATPWNTADLHAVAAEVHAAAGDAEAAAQARARALAIDPHALDGSTALTSSDPQAGGRPR